MLLCHANITMNEYMNVLKIECISSFQVEYCLLVTDSTKWHLIEVLTIIVCALHVEYVCYVGKAQ